jgi:hypothetical protein
MAFVDMETWFHRQDFPQSFDDLQVLLVTRRLAQYKLTPNQVVHILVVITAAQNQDWRLRIDPPHLTEKQPSHGVA